MAEENLKQKRELEIKDDKLIVKGFTEMIYTKEGIKQMLESWKNNRLNLNNGLGNAAARLNEITRQQKEEDIKPSTDLKKVCASMRLTVDNFRNALKEANMLNARTNELDKIGKEMKAMTDQLAEVDGWIAELEPYYEKLAGITNKDKGIG